MAKYGIVKNNKVLNVIVADDDMIVRMIFQDADFIIEESLETGILSMGGEILNGKFKPEQPYPLWSFDEDSWTWQPPIPKPGENYAWIPNENNWVELVPPTE